MNRFQSLLYSSIFIIYSGFSILCLAQDDYGELYTDDYLDNFGDDQLAPKGYSGSRTLNEAMRTGRGYRIGARGVYSKEMPDVYTVRKGDTLWDITEQYYGDPWQWPKVWSYNPEITNPHWIYPLSQIRLFPPIQIPSDQVGGTDGDGSLQPSPKPYQVGTVFLRDYGYLDEEALKTVGQIIGGFEEQMMLSNTDIVYVKFKPEHQVKIGQKYTVFRKISNDERDKEEEGTLVRIYGTVKIDNYDRNRYIARAVIDESLDPIERGYNIAVLDRQFNIVPPKTNQTEVIARIIANLRPRILVGAHNIIFLNVGQNRSVMPGNQFFVVRKGDKWQQSIFTSVEGMGGVQPLPEYRIEDYPNEVVAILRVIKVRKKTSVALVTQSSIDLKVGDKAIMRKGL